MKLSSLSFDQLTKLREAFESEIELPSEVIRQGLHYSNAMVNIQFSWFCVGYFRAKNDSRSVTMSVKNSSNLSAEEALERAKLSEARREMGDDIDDAVIDQHIKGMYFATAAQAIEGAGQPADHIPKRFGSSVMCFLDTDEGPFIGVYSPLPDANLSMGELQDAAELDAKYRLATFIRGQYRLAQYHTKLL